jgi:bud site selection protein 31
MFIRHYEKGDTNFGSASICRVPIAARAIQQQLTPNVRTG